MVGRVLHVIPAVAPRYGGPSRAVVGMCRALADAGVATVVATTDADGPNRLVEDAPGQVLIDGMPALTFPCRLSEAYKWSPALAGWLRRHVADFDLVHVHAVFSHSTRAAGRSCRMAGVPYIVRPLGSLDPWSLRQHGGRKAVLLQFGLRRVLQQATAIHYTTTEERRLAEAAVPGLPQGFVVPLGVEDDLFLDDETARARDPRLVLALTRIDHKKGLELLIDAFHEAARHEPPGRWVLVVAGTGETAYVNDLRTRAARGPAGPAIEFRGWVDGRERRELLKRASLFALPSRQENFGLAVAEAMAAGCPVLVSTAVNLAQDIRAADAGWVVDRTVPAVADALRAASVDGVRVRKGQAARHLAEQFRWARVGAALAGQYAAVINDPAGKARAIASHEDVPAPSEGGR